MYQHEWLLNQYFQQTDDSEAPYKLKYEKMAHSLTAKQCECMVDYLGKLSIASGVGSLWTQYAPKLKGCVEKRKACEQKSTSLRIL